MRRRRRERAGGGGAGFNVHNTTGPIMLAGANMQFNDVFSPGGSMFMFFSQQSGLNNKTSQPPLHYPQ